MQPWSGWGRVHGSPAGGWRHRKWGRYLFISIYCRPSRSKQEWHIGYTNNGVTYRKAQTQSKKRKKHYSIPNSQNSSVRTHVQKHAERYNPIQKPLTINPLFVHLHLLYKTYSFNPFNKGFYCDTVHS